MITVEGGKRLKKYRTGRGSLEG